MGCTLTCPGRTATYTSARSNDGDSTFTVRVELDDNDAYEWGDLEVGAESEDGIANVSYISRATTILDRGEPRPTVIPVASDRMNLSFQVWRSVNHPGEMTESTVTVFLQTPEGERLAEDTMQLHG